MLRIHSRQETRAARRQTAVGVAHLAWTAGLLHIDPSDGEAGRLFGWQVAFAAGMLVCSAAAFRVSHRRGVGRMLDTLLPLTRLPARDTEGRHAYFPGFGWRAIDERLREGVERALTLPMIAIALVVLPLLAAEHFLADRIAASASLTATVVAASAAVWAAFTLEFVVGCTLSAKRLDYCKRHLLDLVIILLPLVAFLRAARLARLASVQKSARVYRLRGLAMKLWKAVVLFDLVGRLLLRTPEKRAANLEQRRETLLQEVAAIDAHIARLRRAA